MTDPILTDLNRRFDYAALKPDVTERDIVKLCADAREYDLFGVAVNPVWVRLARDELAGSDVRIIGVAGFPLGANKTDIKIEEAVKLVSDGAHEIDMVANIGAIIGSNLKTVEQEIRSLRDSLPYNVLLKVIIEAGLLTPEQQIAATKAVINSGAQFVKTSTGFFGNATVEQVKTLQTTASNRIEIKASGGIRTLADCRAMLEAGATRLGSSSAIEILQELSRAKV